jgi:hypothetical protein
LFDTNLLVLRGAASTNSPVVWLKVNGKRRARQRRLKGCGLRAATATGRPGRTNRAHPWQLPRVPHPRSPVQRARNRARPGSRCAKICDCLLPEAQRGPTMIATQHHCAPQMPHQAAAHVHHLASMMAPALLQQSCAAQVSAFQAATPVKVEQHVRAPASPLSEALDDLAARYAPARLPHCALRTALLDGAASLPLSVSACVRLRRGRATHLNCSEARRRTASLT